MGKQCWSQAVLESGSWGHSVLQTPALVEYFFFFTKILLVVSKAIPVSIKIYFGGKITKSALNHHLIWNYEIAEANKFSPNQPNSLEQFSQGLQCCHSGSAF